MSDDGSPSDDGSSSGEGAWRLNDFGDVPKFTPGELRERKALQAITNNARKAEERSIAYKDQSVLTQACRFLKDNGSVDSLAYQKMLAMTMGYSSSRLQLEKVKEPMQVMDLSASTTWMVSLNARFSYAIHFFKGDDEASQRKKLEGALDRCLARCARLNIRMPTEAISRIVVSVMDNKTISGSNLESELLLQLNALKGHTNSVLGDRTPRPLGPGCLPWNLVGSCEKGKDCIKRHSCLACDEQHQVSQCELNLGFTIAEKAKHRSNMTFNNSTKPRKGRGQKNGYNNQGNRGNQQGWYQNDRFWQNNGQNNGFAQGRNADRGGARGGPGGGPRGRGRGGY